MQTLQMNEDRWIIAHDLAFELIDNETDTNEFGKVTAFMRRYQKADDAIDKFMLLLQRLANSNNAPIRSNSTPEYYENIQKSCEKHLKDISDADELMLILGWCMRLMRYYNEEPQRAVEEQYPPQKPKQIPKLPLVQTPPPVKAPEKPKVKVGDRVNATVLSKGPIKVTVRLHTDDNEEVVFESPYYPGQVGKQVKLRVTEVDGTGKVSKLAP